VDKLERIVIDGTFTEMCELLVHFAAIIIESVAQVFIKPTQQTKWTKFLGDLASATPPPAPASPSSSSASATASQTTWMKLQSDLTALSTAALTPTTPPSLTAAPILATAPPSPATGSPPANSAIQVCVDHFDPLLDSFLAILFDIEWCGDNLRAGNKYTNKWLGENVDPHFQGDKVYPPKFEKFVTQSIENGVAYLTTNPQRTKKEPYVPNSEGNPVVHHWDKARVIDPKKTSFSFIHHDHSGHHFQELTLAPSRANPFNFNLNECDLACPHHHHFKRSITVKKPVVWVASSDASDFSYKVVEKRTKLDKLTGLKTLKTKTSYHFVLPLVLDSSTNVYSLHRQFMNQFPNKQPLTHIEPTTTTTPIP
jgi:hypothetical protein